MPHRGGAPQRTGAHLEACVAAHGDAPVAFTLESWHLVAGPTSHPAVGYDWEETAEPGAPIQGQLVEPGDCVTSWVVFDDVKEAVPARITYANAAGNQIQWQVKSS